jgi:hypothetical protein
MNAVVQRISDLLRPSSATMPDNPVRALTIDLGVAGVGFAIFGASIAAGGDTWWTLLVALKIAGIFLTAFVLSLAPLFALKKFFDVEAPFAQIVSVFAGHLALGGIFVSAGAGLFLLLRRGDIDFDGMLAIGLIAASVLGVLVCRARSPLKWLTPVPAMLAVTLFLSLLCQSGWAFRPYMDPHSSTLFQARLEWFAGENRESLERLVIALGGSGGAGKHKR